MDVKVYPPVRFLGIRMCLIFAQIFLLLDTGMKLRIQIVLAFLVASLVASACGSKKTKSLPDHEKKFARVYAELALMRERIPLTNPSYMDSSRALLKKHGFSPEDFKKSLAYFNETPERWVFFYTEVQAVLLTNKSSAAARR
jgi:hypothetical protein